MTIDLRSRSRSMIAAALLAFIAPGAVATAAFAQDVGTTEIMRVQEETARGFYALINGGDADAWRDNLAEGWTAIPPMSADGNDVAGYEGTIAAFRAGFPDLKVEQVEVIQNADVVAVRSLVTGTNTAELFGQTATDKSISIAAMDIHRIVDGKIVGTWHVEDFPSMGWQLAGE